MSGAPVVDFSALSGKAPVSLSASGHRHEKKRASRSSSSSHGHKKHDVKQKSSHQSKPSVNSSYLNTMAGSSGMGHEALEQEVIAQRIKNTVSSNIEKKRDDGLKKSRREVSESSDDSEVILSEDGSEGSSEILSEGGSDEDEEFSDESSESGSVSGSSVSSGSSEGSGAYKLASKRRRDLNKLDSSCGDDERSALVKARKEFERDRAEYLADLIRFKKDNLIDEHITSQSDFIAIKEAVDAARAHVQRKEGLEFMRSFTISVTKGIEFATTTFGNKIKLKGFAQRVEEGIDTYDTSLMAIWKEYGHVFSAEHPFMMLALALTMSGFSVHQDNTRREREAAPAEETARLQQEIARQRSENAYLNGELQHMKAQMDTLMRDVQAQKKGPAPPPVRSVPTGFSPAAPGLPRAAPPPAALPSKVPDIPKATPAIVNTLKREDPSVKVENSTSSTEKSPFLPPPQVAMNRVSPTLQPLSTPLAVQKPPTEIPRLPPMFAPPMKPPQE